MFAIRGILHPVHAHERTLWHKFNPKAPKFHEEDNLSASVSCAAAEDAAPTTLCVDKWAKSNDKHSQAVSLPEVTLALLTHSP